MAGGRKKPHHTHEIGDAYAEGWAARRPWNPACVKPENPYRVQVNLANVAKQSEQRRRTQQLEIEQWDAGWRDCEIDLKRGDLTEVKDTDFSKRRYLVD